MKNISRQLLLGSLIFSATNIAFGQTENYVYVPTLESGITYSVGALYLVPASDFESYYTITSTSSGNVANEVLNIDPSYQFGIDASLGYIFDDTANGVDLFFRNISTSDSKTTAFSDPSLTNPSVTGTLDYDLTAFDLMFSQFINIGRFMETRLMAGLAYTELKQNRTSHTTADNATLDFDPASKFTGFGPRVGVDSRYDFFGGFGLVAGGSFAYYLGELDATTNIEENGKPTTGSDTLDNHAVMNIRANIALDFLVTYDDRDNSTAGLELGYLIDYYDDGIGSNNLFGIINIGATGEAISTSAVSFSGPYINLKGVF